MDILQLGEEVAPAGDAAGEAQGGLPAGLDAYLPASLWQSLAGGDTRRGLLLNALERLRSILYLLSSYLPAHLVQEKMRRPAPGQARGQTLAGSLLFSDVSGFTALSERLAALEDGAEQLTDLMNRYFERMLTILSWSGGILLKFAGDALLVYFPHQKEGEQARWAVRAGQRMIEAMSDFAGQAGGANLRMKVGIGTGRYLAASVGDEGRMEYVILGQAVARTMAAESAAVAGQVVVDEATAACLEGDWLDGLHTAPAEKDGFAVVLRDPAQALDDFEIKVESRRARGAIPWSASPHALAAQMEIVLRQIRALEPFLPAELVERIVAGARRRRVESEYRPTTVIFINFTGLEERLDAWGEKGVRPVTRLLDDYFRTMQAIIARHGGVVSRVDPYGHGSKMLVLFGAPVAHEDDPLRAVTAALAMNEALVALHERWRHSLARRRASALPLPAEGPLLQHRLGITRGETFAGQVGSPTRHEYTVMGDDVNLAARLMSAAAPGQILISQRVYDAVAGHVEATALPPVRVKGKSQPIPIYEPTRMRHDPLARRLQDLKPLVGREAELDAGREAVRRALAGQGGLLAIQGPAGVGKSHLAAQLAAYALARGARALLAECRSYAARAPYAAWIDLLADLLGVAPGGGEEARDRLLRRLSDLDLKAAEIGPHLCTLLDLPAPAPTLTPIPAARGGAGPAGGQPPARASLFGQLQKKVEVRATGEIDLWQLVRERQEAQPGGMWQNLQARLAARQEERMQDAVGDLLARLSEDAPLLLILENGQWLDPASLVLLARLGRRLPDLPISILVIGRDGDDAPQQWPPGTQILALGLLDAEGTAALLAHLLGDEPPAPEVVEGVYRQSDGNPLFVQEIARGVQRAAQGQGPATIGDDSLHDLVLSRLDSLPPDQGRVARAASVAGAHFLRAEVGALLSTLDAAALQGHLVGLEEGGLLLPAGARSQDGPAYSFRQTLVREVVYRSQSFARRRSQHAALAAYLEARYAANLEQHAERLAHHHEQAEQWLPAARYLLLAGHKAARRYAYRQAIDNYIWALSLLIGPRPAGDDFQETGLQAAAYEGIGNALFQLGHFAAAWAAYDAAQAGLDQAPVRLLLKLAQVLPVKGRDEQAAEMAARAWAAEVPAAERETRLATAATMAWLLWRAGDARSGLWIDRGRALASQAASGAWLAGIEAVLADLAGDWAAALRAYRRLDRADGAALAACRLGDRHLAEGDVAGALALFEQALDLWTGENDACGLALARYRRAEALARQGDRAAAVEALQAARELLAQAPLAGDEDRQAIETALAALEAGEAGSWPAWVWQRCDDAFRLSMLFRPSFPETGLPASPGGISGAGPSVAHEVTNVSSP